MATGAEGRAELYSAEQLQNIAEAAIDFGREIEGIQRFGYPSIGGRFAESLRVLKPFRPAIDRAVDSTSRNEALKSYVSEVLDPQVTQKK